MEKTMAMNERMFGIEDTSEVVKEMARNKKRNHVAIWLEVLKDIRSQCEEAENGRFHHRMLGIEDTREVVKEMARNKKRNHVAIWLEVLKDIRSQWEVAEHGRFHSSTS